VCVLAAGTKESIESAVAFPADALVAEATAASRAPVGFGGEEAAFALHGVLNGLSEGHGRAAVLAAQCARKAYEERARC